VLQVNINSIIDLFNAAGEIMQCNDGIHERCKERILQIGQLLAETEREEQFSHGLLQAAIAAESAARVALMAAEAELTVAIAAEVAAIASADPISIAAAAADAMHAKQLVDQARAVYDTAKRHRELMDQRYEMAVQCLNLTKSLLHQVRDDFNILLLTVTEVSHRGASRIASAARDITKYLSEHQPQMLRYLQAASAKKNFDKSRFGDGKIEIEDGDLEFEKWANYEPKEREPVFPEEIRARLNCSPNVQKALLAYLCANDVKFRILVNNYREQARTPGGRETMERRIRIHIVGKLGEEIVLHALKPYGETALTQNRFVTEDGKYTLTDLIVKNLKVPIILGRGAGNGAREGQDLAVEVKCGSPDYILSQMEHMEFQAQGHQASAASCTICSRDIRNIARADQSLLRERLKATGSPMLGMLPYKAELDKVCFEFIFGE